MSNTPDKILLRCEWATRCDDHECPHWAGHEKMQASTRCGWLLPCTRSGLCFSHPNAGELGLRVCCQQVRAEP